MSAYAIPGEEEARASVDRTLRATISKGIGASSGRAGRAAPQSDGLVGTFRASDSGHSGFVPFSTFVTGLRHLGGLAADSQLADEMVTAGAMGKPPATQELRDTPVEYRQAVRAVYDENKAVNATAANFRARDYLGPSHVVISDGLTLDTQWAPEQELKAVASKLAAEDMLAEGTQGGCGEPESQRAKTRTTSLEQLNRISLQGQSHGAESLGAQDIVGWIAKQFGSPTSSNNSSSGGASTKRRRRPLSTSLNRTNLYQQPRRGRSRPGASLKRSLGKLDADRDGRISHRQLLHGLSAAGVQLGPQQAARLLHSLDRRGSGSVSVDNLARMVDDAADTTRRSRQEKDSSRSSTASAIPEDEDSRRSRIAMARLQQGLFKAVGTKPLTALVRHLDDRRVGVMPAGVLVEALQSAGVGVSAEDVVLAAEAARGCGGGDGVALRDTAVDYTALSNALGLSRDGRVHDDEHQGAAGSEASGRGSHMDLSVAMDAATRRDDVVTARVLRRLADGPDGSAGAHGGRPQRTGLRHIDGIFAAAVPVDQSTAASRSAISAQPPAMPRDASASAAEYSSPARSQRVPVPDGPTPSAQVSYSHLRDGLYSAGLPLSDEDFGRVLAAADPTGSGHVEYSSLCDALGVTPTKKLAEPVPPPVIPAGGKDPTVDGDGAHSPLRPGDAALFRMEPGGAFYPVPEGRHSGTNRNHGTTMHLPRSRSAGLAPVGEGLGMGRKRPGGSQAVVMPVAGSATEAPSSHAMDSAPAAIVHVVGVANPNMLTDPQFNPREIQPARDARSRQEAEYRYPSAARSRYLRSMMQTRTLFDIAAGEDGQNTRTTTTAAANARGHHEESAVAEQVADNRSRGLRARHLLLTGSQTPHDVAVRVGTTSHTQIFAPDLPFAREDASLTGSAARAVVKRRAASARRDRRSARLDAIQRSAAQRLASLDDASFTVMRKTASKLQDPVRADTLASGVESLLIKQQQQQQSSVRVPRRRSVSSVASGSQGTGRMSSISGMDEMPAAGMSSARHGSVSNGLSFRVLRLRGGPPE